jgi:hypothetical protein
MPTYLCYVKPDALTTAQEQQIAEHMAKYGSVHPTPGKEKEWFAAMPDYVKTYMAYNAPRSK